jgi:hypothetical protein
MRYLLKRKKKYVQKIESHFTKANIMCCLCKMYINFFLPWGWGIQTLNEKSNDARRATASYKVENCSKTQAKPMSFFVFWILKSPNHISLT